MANEKIIIQIGDEIKELKGVDKETFITQREASKTERDLIENEHKAKQQARENAIKKLAEIAGLSDEEIAAII